ncbi:MAG TPA: CBS domain-containing protein [Gemmatimonadaceae bacterium]|nr:CBS domain-containing protein [Gemmatimonadaceae bacterium]
MLKLSEIMTRDVVTVTPETTLRQAVELFTAKHISGAPVVSGHEVVGVVSATDILEFAASMPERLNPASGESSWNEAACDDEGSDVPAGSYYTDLFADESRDVSDRIDGSGEPSPFDAHTVDEVMTRDAISLSPNESVLSAADIMRGRSIHRVLVVDRGVLVGILSTLDLARAVAEHKLTAKTYVFNKDDVFERSEQ